MTDNGRIPNLDTLSLSDTEIDDTEDLFASPTASSKREKSGNQRSDAKDKVVAHTSEEEDDAQATRDDALRRELASLQNMNKVISGITASLEEAKQNMDTVSATVNNATTLLTTWTRMLSQTEHNQRLILNPSWQGATQDIVDQQNEELSKRQEKERRETEEARRAKEREAERQEEERRRLTEGVAGKGGRGRGKSTGRGSARAGSTGYVGVGGQMGSRGVSRTGSTTGRRGSSTSRAFGGYRGTTRGS